MRKMLLPSYFGFFLTRNFKPFKPPAYVDTAQAAMKSVVNEGQIMAAKASSGLAVPPAATFNTWV